MKIAQYKMYLLLLITVVMYLIIASGTSYSAGQSSTNYAIDSDVLDGGGGVSTGSNLTLYHSLGQTTPLGTLITSNNSLYAGYWYKAQGLDVDGDGIADIWESKYFSDLTTADDTTDSDNDGLPDIDESAYYTDPTSSDTDIDGMPDNWEVVYLLNPLQDDSSSDADTDTESNVREYQHGSDPRDLLSFPITTFINLTEGLNLISAPTNTHYITDAHTYLEIVDSGGLSVDKFERYNGSSGIVEEAYYEQNESMGGYNFSMVEGEGLAVYANEDMSVEISQNNCPQFYLKAGTNWVGTPCDPVNVTASTMLTALGGEDFVSSIQKYSRSKGSFETVGYFNGEIVGADYEIKPGGGYFIFMKQDVSNFTP